MAQRIIQISDCHLLANPAGQLKGVCTRSRFDAVVAALSAERSRADRLIVTGDLTHDERIESYAALQHALADWLPRLRVIPGNHDDRALMRQLFAFRTIEETDRIVFAEDLGAWRWIGLDSQIAGSVSGRLGQEQIDWLRRQLDAFPLRPTLLCVHHPPVGMNSPWLDEIDLQDAADLWAVVLERAQVRAIVTGHVHQESAVLRQHVAVFTTPSTGVQFVPEVETLQIDSAAPGYRVIDLHDDGRFVTRIVRVAVDP